MVTRYSLPYTSQLIITDTNYGKKQTDKTLGIGMTKRIKEKPLFSMK